MHERPRRESQHRYKPGVSAAIPIPDAIRSVLDSPPAGHHPVYGGDEMTHRILNFRFYRTLGLLGALCWSWPLAAAVTTNTSAADHNSLRPIPVPLFGVTVDSITNLSQIVDSLHSLSHKPTTRIVFDKVSASHYVKAVKKIHNVSFVMGELMDSFYMKDYSVDAYLKRTREYYNALSPDVDIWEVGNEINGDWLGNRNAVITKMVDGYDFIKQHHGRTALTLYHDQSSDAMLAWAIKNVPERMKKGLDYVLVSFYEDDQKGIKPDWNYVFRRLAQIFPNSRIGFGEVGTRYWSLKRAYITRYYNLHVSTPRFVGGYFWWYFKQDMVPKNKPMWRVLNNVTLRTAGL